MKISCLVCGTLFEPKTKNHIFCKRRCFKIDYNKRLREKNLGGSPNFLCPKCEKITKIKFDPRKNAKKWNDFTCSHCGYKNNINY
jgi:predicted RNA-binding Zn-ribbon protein involved in translation (DUF1610 family)